MTSQHTAALPDVAGRCPACNGESLFLADGGYVTCSRIDCPQPDAAHEAIDERAGANAYDRAINAPMSDAAAAELRKRLASGDVPRRKVRRREPTLRQQALDAAHDTIRDGRWWLPPAGQAEVVDRVLPVVLAAVSEALRAEADHHTAGAELSRYPECADGHRDLAAGLLAASRHVLTLHRQPKEGPK